MRKVVEAVKYAILACAELQSAGVLGPNSDAVHVTDSIELQPAADEK